MKLTDLKLLIDCAFAGHECVHVGFGFLSAAKRLTLLGLIEGDPSWLGKVRITNAGDLFVDRLLTVAP